MNRGRSVSCRAACFLIVLIALGVGQAAAQLIWPVEPTNADHPIGNSCGEFQDYGGGPYLHTGIDIREDCAPGGPWVRSVTGGTLSLHRPFPGDPSYRYNGVTIVTGPTTYRYWHLDNTTVEPSVSAADGGFFPANSRISQIVDWTAALGNFHHLHFDIIRGSEFICPFGEGLTPEADNVSPDVEKILIYRNGSNTLLPKPATGCWIVDGDLDIIAKASETDPPLPSIPWQGHIGVCRIEYSITELTGTGTHNVPATQLYRFDAFPTAGSGSAEAAIIYKNTPPDADSESDYWVTGGEESYYMVTNVDSAGNLSETNGYWDTDGGGFPNGLYQISVTAYDFVGNDHTKSEIVFVKNNPATPSPVELIIRDRTGDDGTIPSNPGGEPYWISPDIRVDAPPFGVVNETGLPFGPNDHEEPTYDQQNRIYVRVHNIGCSPSAQVKIRLYWADPDGPMLPADWQEIEPAVNKTLTNIPSGGSLEYASPILWKPTGSVVGKRCLLVRLESGEDSIVNDYDVPQENNIAQRNIHVKAGRRSISVHAGGAVPVGTFADDYEASYHFAIDVDYHFTPQLSLVGTLGLSHFNGKPGVTSTDWWNLSANLKYEFTTDPVRPYVNLGPGLYWDSSTNFGFNAGLGLDFSLNPAWSVELGADYHHIFTSGSDTQYVVPHIGLIYRF